MTESEAVRGLRSPPPAVIQLNHREGSVPLTLVEELCSALNAEGINYCHWKSNNELALSATGDNDLDLLIDEDDGPRFSEILRLLGFKEALAPRTRRVPGVVHFLGVDGTTGKFVHIHAHYELMVGDDRTKNYRLPMERAYLESSVQGRLFRVPAPEYEFIGLVIRMLLKHATWDAVLFLRGVMAGAERREFAFLQKRVDLNRIHSLLDRDLPMIDRALFEHCLEALQADASLRFRLATGRALRRHLATSGRRVWWADTGLRVWRRLYWRFERRVLGRTPHKRLAGGGALIAVVGGDGAGKSSVVDGLCSWLGQHFATATVHLGKPPRSMISIMYKCVIVAVRNVFSGFQNAARPPPSLGVDQSAASPGTPRLIWHVLWARDRLRAYRRAHRHVSRGVLVVTDRFPLRQIKMMDGPITDLATEATEGRPVLARLARWEHAYYKHFEYPDVLVVLRIDPDVAVARRRDEEEDFVRTRCTEVWRADWSGTPAVVVDAGRSKSEVLSEVKACVWSRL
jgi:thymidylate kinase